MAKRFFPARWPRTISDSVLGALRWGELFCLIFHYFDNICGPLTNIFCRLACCSINNPRTHLKTLWFSKAAIAKRLDWRARLNGAVGYVATCSCRAVSWGTRERSYRINHRSVRACGISGPAPVVLAVVHPCATRPQIDWLGFRSSAAKFIGNEFIGWEKFGRNLCRQIYPETLVRNHWL